MNDEKKIIIIGAGMAGLSAGVYLQMNGYATEILEAGETPGGLCTAWKRDGYTFDGCIQWLLGSGLSDEFGSLWKELGIAPAVKFIEFDEYLRVESKSGRLFTFYTDIDKLEQAMKQAAPEDAAVIEEFTGAVRKLVQWRLPVEKAPELNSLVENLRLLAQSFPFLPTVLRWKRVSVKEFALRLKSDFLKEVFLAAFGDRISVLAFMMMLSWMHRRSAGYPLGGSAHFARVLEKRYLALGGKVRYGSKVTSITVDGALATGVVCADGSSHAAATVISAADGYTTIFKMLGGKHVDRGTMTAYNTYETFPSIMQVSLGVIDPFKTAPRSLSVPLLRPMIIDNKTRIDRITANFYTYDDSLSPKGKTAITIIIPCVYEYWVNLRHNNLRRYKVEKERIAKEIIGILDNKFEGLASRVELYDVATPATYIRYTGNWKGSMEGWLPTPRIIGTHLPKTLPGLKNFYLIGQWVEPGGGIPAVALTGKQVAQIICQKDQKRFTAAG